MIEIYKELQDLIAAKSYGDLDFIFKSLEVNQMSKFSMLAILRYTFVARGKIKIWGQFFESVNSELIDRGLDAKHLLRGLDAT